MTVTVKAFLGGLNRVLLRKLQSNQNMSDQHPWQSKRIIHRYHQGLEPFYSITSTYVVFMSFVAIIRSFKLVTFLLFCWQPMYLLGSTLSFIDHAKLAVPPTLGDHVARVRDTKISLIDSFGGSKHQPQVCCSKLGSEKLIDVYF